MKLQKMLLSRHAHSNEKEIRPKRIYLLLEPMQFGAEGLVG